MEIVILRPRTLSAALLMLVVASGVADAQACYGTPSHGGVSYDRGATFSGSSNGATATVASQRKNESGPW